MTFPMRSDTPQLRGSPRLRNVLTVHRSTSGYRSDARCPGRVLCSVDPIVHFSFCFGPHVFCANYCDCRLSTPPRKGETSKGASQQRVPRPSLGLSSVLELKSRPFCIHKYEPCTQKRDKIMLWTYSVATHRSAGLSQGQGTPAMRVIPTLSEWGLHRKASSGFEAATANTLPRLLERVLQQREVCTMGVAQGNTTHFSSFLVPHPPVNLFDQSSS